MKKFGMLQQLIRNIFWKVPYKKREKRMPERIKTSNFSFCKILLPKESARAQCTLPFQHHVLSHTAAGPTLTAEAVSFNISLCISKSLSLRLHHWDPATWRIQGRTSGGMQSWKEGGNVPVPLSRGNPFSQIICDVFSQQEDTHLKGLCERSSPTLPHTSGWFVPAATPWSKEDKNLPSSTCMKKPNPTDLPTPRKCPRSAPLSPPAARWWRGEVGKGKSTAPRVLTTLCKSHGNAVLRGSPWGESELPLASSPEPSQSMWRSKQDQQTRVSCAESRAHGSRESGCFLT